MEEEKAAATASMPDDDMSSSEEAFEEIEEDNNQAKETGSPKIPSSAQIEESEQAEKIKEEKATEEEAVDDEIECHSNDADEATPISEAGGGKKLMKDKSTSDKALISRKDVRAQLVVFIILRVSPILLTTLMIVVVFDNTFITDDEVALSAFGMYLSMLTTICSLLSCMIVLDFMFPKSWLYIIAACPLPLIIRRGLRELVTPMFTDQLITHIGAGLYGYALAQCRMLLKTKDTEKMHTRSNEAERSPFVQMATTPINVLINLGVAFRLVWVLSHSADYTPVGLTMHLLLPQIGGLLFWITVIVVSLGDAFMGEDGLTLIIFYFFFIMLMYILLVVTLGQIVASSATWLASLGLSGFLGYSYHIFNSLRATKDTKDLDPQASSLQSSCPDSSS